MGENNGRAANRVFVKLMKDGGLEDMDGNRLKDVTGVLCGVYCENKEGNYGPYRMWKFQFAQQADDGVGIGTSNGTLLSLSVLKDYVAHGIINMLLSVYVPVEGVEQGDFGKGNSETVGRKVSLHFSLTDKGFISSSAIFDGQRAKWKHSTEYLMKEYVEGGRSLGDKAAVNEYKALLFKEFAKHLNDVVKVNWKLVNVVGAGGDSERASGDDQEFGDDIPF